MNDLINVNFENDNPTISGRDLHETLEIDTQYTKWFDRMCEYGFTESIDYLAISQKRLTAQGNETTYNDHQLTIDMAKQICMIQRTDKGRLYREYFIGIEKQWNTPEAVMARALHMADKKLTEIMRINMELHEINSELNIKTQIMAPKAEYFDALIDKNLLTNFRDTAKQLLISEKVFIKFLMDNRYIYRDTKNKICPYADRNNGLFEIKEGYNKANGWTGTQTLITPKGRETFRLLCKSISVKED